MSKTEIVGLVPTPGLQAINLKNSEREKDPFTQQVGGVHYKSMKIQPVEFILANELGFCEGNIVKYICRYRQKNGVEDLKKVVHYAQLLISSVEGKGEAQ